jgi:DNA-binding transcriptional regulator YiaG
MKSSERRHASAIHLATAARVCSVISNCTGRLTAKQIRAIRIRSRVSQAVFAAMLNTSISTVQKWEIGEKRPSGPSLKLLDVIQRKGIGALS